MPATISQPRDLFVTALTEMLYVEQKQADQVLPELRDDVQTPVFKQGVERHIEETQRHVENLEQVFELLGEEAKADKSHSLDGLVAQREKVIKNIDSEQVREVFNAGAAAKTEHLEIAAYESLIRSAQGLGQTEIVELLEENLADEQDTLKEIEQLSAQLTSETASR